MLPDAPWTRTINACTRWAASHLLPLIRPPLLLTGPAAASTSTQLLTGSPASPGLQQLSSLTACSRHSRPDLSADVQRLVQQLGGRGKHVAHLKAAKDLIACCSNDVARQSTAVAAGAVPALVKLLASTSITVQEQAARALKAVSNSTGTAAAVGAAGAVPPLVQLLGSRSGAVQAAAADALSTLAASAGAENNARAASAGAIPPLVQLLGSPSEEAQLSAVRALAAVCLGDRDNRASMVEAGGIPPLVRLLGSGPMPAQRLIQTMMWELCSSPSNQAQLALAGVVPPLVKLLSGSSVHGSEPEAAAALAAVCINNVDNKAQAVAACAIPALLPLLGSEQGAVALAVLCSPSTNDSELVSAGAIPSLVQLLGCKLEKVAVKAGAALSSLCRSSVDDMDRAVAAGAIPALVQLLDCAVDKVKEMALPILASMCQKSADAAARAAAAGAIPALVPLLGSDLGSTKHYAAWALQPLCCASTGSQAAMIRAGAVGPLLQLVALPSCRVYATDTLRSIQLGDAGNQLALAAAGAVPLLVQQLGSDEELCRAFASLALMNTFMHVADVWIAAAVQSDLPALRALLDSPAAEVTEAAAVVALVAVLVWTVSMAQQLNGGVNGAEQGGASQPGSQHAPAVSYEELQEAMLRLEGRLQGLVSLAAQHKPALGVSGHSAAALDQQHVLAFYWAEAVQQSKAFAPGGQLRRLAPEHAATLGVAVRPVIALGMLLLAMLATSNVADVKNIAATAFRDVLGFNERGDSKFAYSGSLYVLIPLLVSGNSGAQQLASEAVLGFSTCAAQRRRLVAEGAIPALVQQLGCRFGEAQKHAVAALCNLSVDADGQVGVAAAAGALPGLVQLLGCGCEEEQHNAALALMNISSNAGAKAMVASARAIPALVRLLGSASEAVQSQAAGALAGIFHNAGWQVTMEAACVGAIPALVQLLGSSSVAVQQQAAEALMNFTSAQLNGPIVASAGAIPPLVQLLGSKSAAVQQRACGALRNMCCCSADPGHGPVEDAVPTLVHLLDSSSASVQEMAAGALRNMFFHTAARRVDEVSPAAIPALVRLLGSTSEAVQEHAAGALRNISFNAASCPLLVSAGAVPPLEQLRGSKSAVVLEQAEAALCNIHHAPANI